jgi:TolB-like protein/class 3 adenylate cyclase
MAAKIAGQPMEVPTAQGAGEAPRISCLVFADLVGYSRLMEKDQWRTMAAFTAARDAVCAPSIERHGGRLIKTTGDGFLAEFASAAAGVTCAVDIQRAMAARDEDPRLAFRMGIHVGAVIEESGDLYGHDVNVAARLQSLSEPEGLCLSHASYEAVRGKLEMRFDDGGISRLHNMSRPIRIWRWSLEERSFDAHLSDTPTLPPLPSRPSLAVLPFDNFSASTDQDYFADGLAEEIITALAKIRWLFVISRNSSFAYRNRPVDIRQVSSELGVRYVVEGSVRRAGNEVRITAQLADGVSGSALWADAVTGTLDQVFELQASVAANVAGAIEPKLRSQEVERAQRKPTRNLDAYDCYLRTLPHLYSGSIDDTVSALALLDRALALDPDYALALAMRGWCRTHQFLIGAVKPSTALAADVTTQIRKAVALGRDDAEVLSLAAMPIVLFGYDYEAGKEWIDTSLHINPSSSATWHRSGAIRCWMGEYTTAAEHLRRAMRLSPADPLMHQFQFTLGGTYLFLRDWEQAISWCRRAIANNRYVAPAYRILAIALVESGRLDEARAAIKEMLSIDPFSSLARSQTTPLRDPDAKSRYLDGLRKAGLPE